MLRTKYNFLKTSKKFITSNRLINKNILRFFSDENETEKKSHLKVNNKELPEWQKKIFDKRKKVTAPAKINPLDPKVRN
jgi:hypothetical protein